MSAHSTDPVVNIDGVGSVVGISHPDCDVLEFRGIPYATIDARFSKSQILNKLPISPFDGTKFGPKPPQPVSKSVIFQGTNLEEVSVPIDEFNCLNLNIACPNTSLISTHQKLPVLVWIYGGAFSWGYNSSPVYSLKHLVDKSVKNGTPVIAVSINYRLNYFGFLTSKEIIEDPACSLNCGLLDQRVALQWINSHIQNFGGDPNRITIFGESAGSISCHAHLTAGIPLFSRAILQSGLLGNVLGPRNPYDPDLQRLFDALLARFNIKEDKINSLRKVPMQDLIDALYPLKGQFASFSPLDDSSLEDGFFTAGKTESNNWLWHSTSPNWCPEIIIGDCACEGIIYSATWGKLDKDEILSPLGRLFPSDILATYGLDEISTQSKQKEEISPALIKFMGDIRFLSIISVFQQNYPGTVYAYHFDRGNPLESPLKGIAHHAIDCLYCFGIDELFDEDRDKEIVDHMVKYWAAFANGESPWEPIKLSGRRKVFDHDGSVKMMSREEIHSRNWEGIDQLAKHVDAMRVFGMAVVNGFLNDL